MINISKTTYKQVPSFIKASNTVHTNSLYCLKWQFLNVTIKIIKWVCLKTSYMLSRWYLKRSDFQPKCDWQTLKIGAIFTLRIYCSTFADPLAYLCSCINEAFNLVWLQQNQWNSYTVQQELFFENMKLRCQNLARTCAPVHN